MQEKKELSEPEKKRKYEHKIRKLELKFILLVLKRWLFALTAFDQMESFLLVGNYLIKLIKLTHISSFMLVK